MSDFIGAYAISQSPSREVLNVTFAAYSDGNTQFDEMLSLFAERTCLRTILGQLVKTLCDLWIALLQILVVLRRILHGSLLLWVMPQVYPDSMCLCFRRRYNTQRVYLPVSYTHLTL